MKTKTIFTVFLTAFVALCTCLVIESGLFANPAASVPGCILLQTPAETKESAKPAPVPEAFEASTPVILSVRNANPAIVTLGSVDKDAGYKYLLELNSKTAAISKATFSEFTTRDHKDPQPLEILKPYKKADGSEILSFASNAVEFPELDQRANLSRTNWKAFDVVATGDGSQTAKFETLLYASGKPLLKLTKTYKVIPDSYHLYLTVDAENLSIDPVKARFDISGPVSMQREAARMDGRKITTAFINAENKIVPTKIKIDKFTKESAPNKRRIVPKTPANFLWVAGTNKYFAAILAPQADQSGQTPNWIGDKIAHYYDVDRETKGDETLSFDFKVASNDFSPAGTVGSKKTYNFMVYIGPKDKTVFDKNEIYRSLGFVQTIDFLGCCCPAAIIRPMAFGILAAMKWMYGIIGNYGIVIIILVFCIRLAMHPITKKSQISMMHMQKLAPKAEEIKKKYANNKAELNKQVMALYRKHGASPIMGFLPMLVQMPIWIALYSAIYASIDLRGAAFLPVWITDLSAPDMLFKFPGFKLPFFGEYFNLLPIMMGFAFYLQQKLMPHQKPSAAASSPQAQQQQQMQKMMQVMMPLMFPFFLYSAPSGLNLYIMASTFAGVIEQYIIRKHIREKEAAEESGFVAVTSKTGGKVKKKKPKPQFRNYK